MSVATTTTGEPDAHASPRAPRVLAAPGPVVVIATPTWPEARAYPSAAYTAVCSCRTPTSRIDEPSSAFHAARLCTPGRPKHTFTPADSSPPTSSSAPVAPTRALYRSGDPRVVQGVVGLELVHQRAHHGRVELRARRGAELVQRLRQSHRRAVRAVRHHRVE